MSQLVVPDDERWLDVFGVAPRTEESSGDDYVREVMLPVAHGDQLRLTWDLTDSSFRLRSERSETVVIDLYREFLTRISVERGQDASWLVIEYGKPGIVGRLHVRVDGGVTIEDSLLQQ